MVRFTDAEWDGVLDMVGRIERGEYRRELFLALTDAELARFQAAYAHANALRRMVMLREQAELLTRPEGARR